MTLISVIIRLFLSDGAALARTAPEPMIAADGAWHVAMAEIAGARHQVDPNLILSIAAHESRYVLAAATPEIGGLVSCGVMTPTPISRCDSKIGELGGYEAGAKHLRDWIDAAHGDLRTALLGYAGGYVMIRACAVGPVIKRRGNRDVDLCSIADVFTSRAEWIRRERRRRVRS